jgi:hypothetical protein
MDCERASPNVIQLYEQQQYHHQEQNFASCAIKTNDSFVREKRRKANVSTMKSGQVIYILIFLTAFLFTIASVTLKIFDLQV